MNAVKVCLVLVFLGVVVEAGPAKAKFEEADFEDPLSLQPRITCDLLGPSGYSDSLCAGHCIMKGFKGGWCDSRKVCNCRR
ncbi:sapecin-B-like [Sergentomyia squamirostris]